MVDLKTRDYIEGFCREYYDSQIFHASSIANMSASSFWENAYNKLLEADLLFQNVDRTLFRNELTALRLEVFALAWGLLAQEDKFTFPQSILTRRYLEENNRFDYWNMMGDYNRIIAASVDAAENGDQIDGRMGTERLAYFCALRSSVGEKWAEANKGLEKRDFDFQFGCAARVINRIGSHIDRADCVLSKYLAARLSNRLGCNQTLKQETNLRLARSIFGFYKDAEEIGCSGITEMLVIV